MDKKAILFTLDALFALILAFSFFVYFSFYFSDVENILYSNIDLLEKSNDVLAVLEKSNNLVDSTQIQTYLDALPAQICANITVYNSGNIMQLSELKSGCTPTEENTITRRVFISEYNPYLAVMEAWYLEE